MSRIANNECDSCDALEDQVVELEDRLTEVESELEKVRDELRDAGRAMHAIGAER